MAGSGLNFLDLVERLRGSQHLFITPTRPLSHEIGSALFLSSHLQKAGISSNVLIHPETQVIDSLQPLMDEVGFFSEDGKYDLQQRPDWVWLWGIGQASESLPALPYFLSGCDAIQVVDWTSEHLRRLSPRTHRTPLLGGLAELAWNISREYGEPSQNALVGLSDSLHTLMCQYPFLTFDAPLISLMGRVATPLAIHTIETQSIEHQNINSWDIYIYHTEQALDSFHLQRSFLDFILKEKKDRILICLIGPENRGRILVSSSEVELEHRVRQLCRTRFKVLDQGFLQLEQIEEFFALLPKKIDRSTDLHFLPWPKGRYQGEDLPILCHDETWADERQRRIERDQDELPEVEEEEDAIQTEHIAWDSEQLIRRLKVLMREEEERQGELEREAERAFIFAGERSKELISEHQFPEAPPSESDFEVEKKEPPPLPDGQDIAQGLERGYVGATAESIPEYAESLEIPEEPQEESALPTIEPQEAEAPPELNSPQEPSDIEFASAEGTNSTLEDEQAIQEHFNREQSDPFQKDAEFDQPEPHIETSAEFSGEPAEFPSPDDSLDSFHDIDTAELFPDYLYGKDTIQTREEEPLSFNQDQLESPTPFTPLNQTPSTPTTASEHRTNEKTEVSQEPVTETPAERSIPSISEDSPSANQDQEDLPASSFEATNQEETDPSIIGDSPSDNSVPISPGTATEPQTTKSESIKQEAFIDEGTSEDLNPEDLESPFEESQLSSMNEAPIQEATPAVEEEEKIIEEPQPRDDRDSQTSPKTTTNPSSQKTAVPKPSPEKQSPPEEKPSSLTATPEKSSPPPTPKKQNPVPPELRFQWDGRKVEHDVVSEVRQVKRLRGGDWLYLCAGLTLIFSYFFWSIF